MRATKSAGTKTKAPPKQFVVASLWCRISDSEARVLHRLARPYVHPEAQAAKEPLWTPRGEMHADTMRRLVEKGLAYERVGEKATGGQLRRYYAPTAKGWLATGYSLPQAERYTRLANFAAIQEKESV